MLKKKTLLLTIALFAASAGLWAQQNDSLTFAKAKWDTKKVAKGIVWKQYHFKDAEKIFGAEEFVNVIEVDQKKAKKRFAFYHKPENLSRTSNAAIEKDAVVAINGTFYNMRPPYNSVCFFKVDGRIIYARKGNMADRENGTVLIDGKGRLSLSAVDGTEDKWEEKQDAPSMMSSGPMLVDGSKRIELSKSSFNTLRHPRTAIATDGNKVYLITVDGRSKGNSLGVNLNELASMLIWLGAEKGLNLDGGGSTTMYVKGEPENGIVNRPSDNQKFDNKGERRVANSILLL